MTGQTAGLEKRQDQKKSRRVRTASPVVSPAVLYTWSVIFHSCIAGAAPRPIEASSRYLLSIIDVARTAVGPSSLNSERISRQDRPHVRQ